MKNPKLTLKEEIKKINKYQSGAELDYRDFIVKSPVILREQTQILKDVVEPKGELQLEMWPALARVLAGVGMYAARATKSIPILNRLFNVSTKGLTGIKGISGLDKVARGGRGLINTATIGGRGGLAHTAALSTVTNARARNGLAALATLAGGGYLAATGGGYGYGPGSAVAAMEEWAQGGGSGSLSTEDLIALAFNPAVYDEAEKQGLVDEIPFNFQSETVINSLAEMIHDATEGGEKYIGKDIVDFVSMDVFKQAGTDEESIQAAFQSVDTIFDCSHLTGIYNLKYATTSGGLLEELDDELDEKDLLRIYNTLKNKPLCIINGKKIFNLEDYHKEIEGLVDELWERPEGLPAYRIKFKELFGGQTVDVFVDVKGKADIAIVFAAGSKDYLGMFEYIPNSDEKVYFHAVDGTIGSVTNDEDKAKVMKILNKGEELSDLLTLSGPIEVNGVVYEEGETLDMIEGDEGTADEYLDELADDNPTTATRKPLAIQGAAIALAMGVNDFEILEESVQDLRKVLGESKIVIESKYTVKYDKDNDKHKISRHRKGGVDPTPTTPTPSESKTAPSLEDAAEGKGLIKKGQDGTSIKRLQKFLRMTQSGTFDDTTEQEVKNYQTTNRLKVDGIVGKQTATAILQAIDTPLPKSATASDQVKVDNFKGTKEDMESITKTLKKDIELSATKEGCKDLISYASELLPQKGGKKVYQALQHCYADYNFIGGGSSKVKSEYGITSKGDPKPTRTQKRQARQTKRRNKKK